MSYTKEQFEALGRLVARWASDPANRCHFAVQPEFCSGGALLCGVTWNDGDEPRTLWHGIEPDGYTHT